jgi:hypothetical protein
MKYDLSYILIKHDPKFEKALQMLRSQMGMALFPNIVVLIRILTWEEG